MSGASRVCCRVCGSTNLSKNILRADAQPRYDGFYNSFWCLDCKLWYCDYPGRHLPLTARLHTRVGFYVETVICGEHPAVVGRSMAELEIEARDLLRDARPEAVSAVALCRQMFTGYVHPRPEADRTHLPACIDWLLDAGYERQSLAARGLLAYLEAR